MQTIPLQEKRDTVKTNSSIVRFEMETAPKGFVYSTDYPLKALKGGSEKFTACSFVEDKNHSSLSMCPKLFSAILIFAAIPLIEQKSIFCVTFILIFCLKVLSQSCDHISSWNQQAKYFSKPS